MKHLILCALLGMAGAASAAPPVPPVPPPAALAHPFIPVFAPKRLSEDVRILASDTYEGRDPATGGELRSVDYLVKQMGLAGLQPGGDVRNGKRGWTQAVPLLRSENVGTPQATIRLAGTQQTLTQGQEIVMRATVNGSGTVAIDNAPIVFVGYGVNAPERQWDDFKGVDLHGKIALVLINDPDFETGVGDFGGREMTYYGRWMYKFEEAARRGAKGMLIVHETAPASYGWESVRNTDTLPRFDIVRTDPWAAHSLLEGWIHRDTAVSLFQRAGLDFEMLKRTAQTRAFRPVELGDARFSTQYAVNLSTIISQNVIGRVEGRRYPDEAVVYTAHWDHLGAGVPDAEGDHIFNGALDNASGTASVVELGRQFAHGPQPERSVVFLVATGEERGLLGSEYYVTNPLYPLAKTAGVINLDILDPHGPARNFTSAGNPKVQLLEDLKTTARRWNVRYTSDPRLAAGRFFRSDHFSFAKRGVPAIWFESGNDWYDGGTAAGDAEAADYNTNRYHQRNDEWQASWPFTGIARDLLILHQFGRDLANSRRWPNWNTDSEFRAIRDKTATTRN